MRPHPRHTLLLVIFPGKTTPATGRFGCSRNSTLEGQEQYGRMMDQVRAQQAYQSGSSSWDNSYGLSDHYGMMFDKFANLGIGGSLKWMANSVLNRTTDHDAAARSFATALGNDLGISDSAKFADAAQKYAETMTGIKTGDNSGAMMAIGAVLMGRFRLAGSAAGALGAEVPGLARLAGVGLQQLGRQAVAWMAAHPEQAMGMAAIVPGAVFSYLAARESGDSSDWSWRPGEKLPAYNGTGHPGQVEVISGRPPMPGYYDGTAHDWSSGNLFGFTLDRPGLPGLRFSTYPTHYPNVDNAWDVLDHPAQRPVPLYGPSGDFTVDSVKTGTEGPASGYGSIVRLRLVSDPTITLDFAHLTHISADVMNAAGLKIPLPAATFLGDARYIFGLSDVPHSHVEGARNGAALTRGQMYGYLK